MERGLVCYRQGRGAGLKAELRGRWRRRIAGAAVSQCVLARLLCQAPLRKARSSREKGAKHVPWRPSLPATKQHRPEASSHPDQWFVGVRLSAWAGGGSRFESWIIFPARRFEFKIDPQTPLAELLPLAPDVVTPLSPWLVRDWAEVPEVHFQKSPARPKSDSAPAKPLEDKEAVLEAVKSLEASLQRTALTVARINHVNQKGRDHFLKTLVERRSDLTGLPFVMGDDCRQSKERGLAFLQEVGFVRDALLVTDAARSPANADPFWAHYEKTRGSLPSEREYEINDYIQTRIAALMQMLAPEGVALRQGLVKYLAGIDHKEATRAPGPAGGLLLRGGGPQVGAGVTAQRPTEDSTDILLGGLRYPWPRWPPTPVRRWPDLAARTSFPSWLPLWTSPTHAPRRKGK